MMPTISSPAATYGAANQNSPATASSTPPPVNKNMFMQLLVAQMRNQDPLNPTDGTQFVAQLAQFEQLEQSVNSAQDITGIRADLDQLVADQYGGTGSQS